MEERYLDLLMNPVRMKIIQSLLIGKKMTVQRIGERMSETPQATLYRHLNKLLKSGVIEVVEENQIRGTVEKVYGLAGNFMAKTNEQMLSLTSEEHSKYFFTFLMNLMEEFDQYINQESRDMMKDGVMYRKAEMYMNDEEFKEYMTGLSALMSRYINNEPSSDRKLRTFGSIIIPQVGGKK